MSEEDFAHHTAALATNKLQRDTTLVHEGDRAWEQVCVAGGGGDGRVAHTQVSASCVGLSRQDRQELTVCAK